MVYFKQYGPQRSGTNYLKRLIELNFKEVTVFASILGWKHGMYETANGYRWPSESHADWINRKTKNGKVYSVDNYALKYTPEELLAATNDLNYLISVKDPYAFIVSFKKFRARNQDWNADKVKNWLNIQYLNNYTNWINLYRANTDKCMFIDYTSIITDNSRQDTLLKLANKFSLNIEDTKFKSESRTVKASTDHGLIIGKDSFNSTYYLNQEYMGELPDDIRVTIESILSRSETFSNLQEILTST